MKDEILTVLREYLTVDVHADEWDEPPSLCLILRGADGVTGFEPLPVGVEAWYRAPVYEVVYAVADVTRAVSEHGYDGWLADGESLLGVVLFSEGWGVSGAKGDEFAQIQAYTEAGGRLEDHPLGVECKMVNAVLVDGAVLILTYFRNGEFLDPDDGDVSGRIPTAMMALLSAFQAVSA